MTKLEATLITALRDIGCSWRKIAELYSEGAEDDDTSPLRGKELCQEAAKVLGIGDEDVDDE